MYIQEDDGWGERKLANYDPYEGAFSDDSEYEVSLPLFI